MTETNAPEEFQEWSLWKKLVRRKFWKYPFLDFKLQAHFAVLLAIIGGVNVLYFGLLIFFYYEESILRLEWLIREYALPLHVLRSEEQRYLFTVPFIGAFEIMLVIFLGLFFSHRVAGPLFAMGRKLKAIAEGQVPSFVRLRKNDLLTTYADQLNDVITTLGRQRQDLENALADISAGNIEGCKEKLEKLTAPPPGPVPDSTDGGTPPGTDP